MSGLAAAVLEAPAPMRRVALRQMFGAERMLERRNDRPPFAPELVRDSATAMFHPAGTCAMGSADDPRAVVDAGCRVRGLEGLRVADASVMPIVPRANTNIPTIMVAERAADLIRGRTM
jgi:5-(hydroxymethyl)furfural/furfural oxidase